MELKFLGRGSAFNVKEGKYISVFYRGRSVILDRLWGRCVCEAEAEKLAKRSQGSESDDYSYAFGPYRQFGKSGALFIHGVTQAAKNYTTR